MTNKILFHGSDQVIENPRLELGNIHNDYGQGFYCTEFENLAGEWACKNGRDGFINRYRLNKEGLKILDLLDGSHTVLNWIALLLKNRVFRLSTQIAIDARQYLIDNFAPDTSAFDLVIGYRADDSYFQYAESFVENGLSVRGLNKALHLGRLGMQTVLISGKAFEQISFESALPADNRKYYPKYLERDSKARNDYSKDIAHDRTYREDLFIMDILREEMTNDDPRIQRYLSL